MIKIKIKSIEKIAWNVNDLGGDISIRLAIDPIPELHHGNIVEIEKNFFLYTGVEKPYLINANLRPAYPIKLFG